MQPPVGRRGVFPYGAAQRRYGEFSYREARPSTVGEAILQAHQREAGPVLSLARRASHQDHSGLGPQEGEAGKPSRLGLQKCLEREAESRRAGRAQHGSRKEEKSLEESGNLHGTDVYTPPTTHHLAPPPQRFQRMLPPTNPSTAETRR